ncbi:MAG: hypothetical protein J6L99_05740 [Ruminococcus sp.]|nr:hypothetical protein [Ruminococcus sp.]
MKNKIKSNTPAFIVCMLYAVFSFIQSICLVFGGDDFWWKCLDSPSLLFGAQDINGRYVTNLLTYAITHSTIIRAISGTILLFGLFIFMALVLRRKGVDAFWAVFFSAVANFSIPKNIAYFTTNWISGITNYILSIFLTFVFIYICKPVFNGEEYKKSQLVGILTLILGLVGAFCLENVTIYNCALALFMIVYYWVRFKKIHFINIGYFIGSVAGLLIMMLNKNYSSIISENNDFIGIRHIEFAPADIIQTIYTDVIRLFAKPFYLIHLCIALCLTLLFFKKYQTIKNAEKHKYAKCCLVIVILFAIYSFLVNDKMDLMFLDMHYRIRAIETAFTFMYIISVVYIAYCVLDKTVFFRFTFYITSVIFVSAPFLVVKPVTSRCFFATFVFWCMAAGEVFIETVKTFNIKKNDCLKYLSICCISGFTLYFSYVNIANKLVDSLRNKYIIEQFESNAKVIEIIKLPYPDYAVDSAFDLLSEKDIVEFSFNNRIEGYDLLYMGYLGLDVTKEEIDSKKYIQISTYDYYNTHSEE